MQLLAMIHLEAIHKIFDCIGLAPRPPPIARALPEREIDELDFS